MDSLPVILAVGALVLGAAGFLVTRAARRRIDPGDFERRLEEMRKGRPLTANSGAVIGHAPRSAPEPEPAGIDDHPGSRLPPAPTLESFTAPPPPPTVYQEPTLGEFTFNAKEGTWEQDDDGGPVRWLYIVAGPEGPTEVQRRCLAAFVEDGERIVERACDEVRATVEARGQGRPVMEPESVWIEAVTSDQTFARGGVYFRFDGFEGLPASAATSDDWVTLEVEIDPAPSPIT